MGTVAEDRLAFDVQWRDPRTDVTWKYQLYFYPVSGEIEMFDVKNRKTFLRRCQPEGSSFVPEVLRPGATVSILSRQLYILGYSDTFTKGLLNTKQERTLAIIKPGAVHFLGEILQIIEAEGLNIGGLQMCLLTKKEAEQFYAIHRNQPFFDRLIAFMTSGRVAVIELLSQGAVKKWRDLIGPTDSEVARQTAPSSIRARFGTDKTQNACHGSDSTGTAAEECSFFFKGKVGRCWGSGDSTLCIVKPHVVSAKQLGIVIATLQKKLLSVFAARTCHFSHQEAVQLLEIYRGVVPLSEFAGIVEEVCSGMCCALEVTAGGGPAVEALRAVCGPADPVLAKALRPETLRAQYGVSKAKNVVHCTDLEEDAAKELRTVFGS